jgi:hypothetical protein
MQERAEVRGLTLKLNTTASTVQTQLDTLQAALAGKSLAACP